MPQTISGVDKSNSGNLTDLFSRKLNYLRISITDRCNLRCMYCQPHNTIPMMSHFDVLRFEEILRLIRIFVYLGVTKIRITGGEPLVRRGVYPFLHQLTAVNSLRDVSLTTNGVLLNQNLDKLWSAGIRRINISLDTLQPEKFIKITGEDYFDQVWEGIENAHKMGFAPVKLNVVVMNGINDDELLDLARLTFCYPFHIRFIEYMPIGDAEVFAERSLLTPEIKKRISVLGQLIPLKNQPLDGPAQRFRFQNAIGEIGFISAMSHHFCSQCNRLRLTAGGQLRPCLLSDREFDLKEAMRKGASDRELADIILHAARHKPHDHNLTGGPTDCVTGRMSAIGG